MDQQKLFQQPDFPAGAPRIGEVEEWCQRVGYRYIVGVDEAGRGPLAGPVVAAAVLLDLQALDAPWVQALDDSKKLDEPAREELFERIQSAALSFGIARRDHAAIARINILQATFRAMEDAVAQALADCQQSIDCVFIDGNKTVQLRHAQRAVVKGDARSRAIAAASILAKVSRDRMMREYHQRWPVYGFLSHKGYPTRAHKEAIAQHGPCPIHRLTFKGVREFVRAPAPRDE